MRSTAAGSVQSKDPSAGWSVARGASGGLLNENERLIYEQGSDASCLEV